MKKIHAALFASLLLASAAHAGQPDKAPKPAAPNAAQNTGAMQDNDNRGGMGKLEDLNLTDDQKQKTQAIQEEAHKKIEAARAEAHQKMLQLLTPEQTKKFESNRQKIIDRMKSRQENRQDARQERRGNNRGEGRGDAPQTGK